MDPCSQPEVSTESQQKADDFAFAVTQAWCEADLDPMLDGSMALSPSGQGCCACY